MDKSINLKLFDTSRQREIPATIAFPEDRSSGKVVVFSHGYQSQDILQRKSFILGYKLYKYLEEFFTSNGYAFISIQHDLPNDNDGLETIDQNLVQHHAREHLYRRGVENILFVLNELQSDFPQLNYDKFVICGHSNGGDISKYFANKYPERISEVIAVDARRCRIESPMRILMFEANDTVTDAGVIPEAHDMREKVDLVVVKPKNALHAGYCGDGVSNELKSEVFSAISWFLKLTP
jgi:pimeloyl-ACP methyl ester carboxylesterase